MNMDKSKGEDLPKVYNVSVNARIILYFSYQRLGNVNNIVSSNSQIKILGKTFYGFHQGHHLHHIIRHDTVTTLRGHFNSIVN